MRRPSQQDNMISNLVELIDFYKPTYYNNIKYKGEFSFTSAIEFYQDCIEKALKQIEGIEYRVTNIDGYKEYKIFII